jgi:UDP-3-O-acyl N-acetylglucosamine deacetylase
VPRRTIARPAELTGLGLHSGVECRVRLEPGAVGAGIVFGRDAPGSAGSIPARLDAVTATDRRTALGEGADRIETVEHLLAALYALGIDDLYARVTGPEIPILDGSFAPFVQLVDRAGIREQPGGVTHADILAPFDVAAGDSGYRISPAAALEVDVRLSHAHPLIGEQGTEHRITPESFRAELQGARTFGMLDELDALRSRGLLGGATADCAVVLDDRSVVNTALRWTNEFARHKAGDLIGDLALLGVRLYARVEAFRPSHRGNITCARAIARAARFTEDA